jgi:hypothetical protein
VDPEKFVAFLTEYVQEPFPHNAMYIAYYCVGVDILELNEDFELEEESPCIMGIDVMETEDVSHLVNLKVFPGGDMCFTDEVAKRDTPFFTLEELQQLLV